MTDYSRRGPAVAHERHSTEHTLAAKQRRQVFFVSQPVLHRENRRSGLQKRRDESLEEMIRRRLERDDNQIGLWHLRDLVVDADFPRREFKIALVTFNPQPALADDE